MREIRTLLLFAVFRVACGPLGYSQSISNVAVSSKPAAQGQMAEFDLTIKGRDFGSDTNQIKVAVSPKANVGQPGPIVTSLSQGGTILTATFTAPQDYDPDTVTVTIAGNPSEPYVVSTAPAQSDLKKYVRVYRTLI